MQGGYRSWVQEGLRVKEPKPETTLTILNEVIPYEYKYVWTVSSAR
jgi:hypothetical protein